MYSTCYKCPEMLLKEPISAVPPSLSNVDCVEKKCEGLMSKLQQGGAGGCIIFTSCCVSVPRVLTMVA